VHQRIAEIGAAVFVFDAVDRLGLVRALVSLVVDTIKVVVGLRAAVFVFEAILVFGRDGAGIGVVGGGVLVEVGRLRGRAGAGSEVHGQGGEGGVGHGAGTRLHEASGAPGVGRPPLRLVKQT
jgi:hypothetical protein